MSDHLPCNVHLQVDIAVDPLDGTTLVSQVRIVNADCLCPMSHEAQSYLSFMNTLNPSCGSHVECHAQGFAAHSTLSIVLNVLKTKLVSHYLDLMYAIMRPGRHITGRQIVLGKAPVLECTV